MEIACAPSVMFRVLVNPLFPTERWIEPRGNSWKRFRNDKVLQRANAEKEGWRWGLR